MMIATGGLSSAVSSRSTTGVSRSASALGHIVFHQAARQIELRSRVSRLQCECLLEFCNGVGTAPLRHECVTQVVMGIHPIWVVSEQIAIRADRLVELTRLLQPECAPEQRF